MIMVYCAKIADMETTPDLDLNPNFLGAFESIEFTGRNIFVTGRAGTGKSTLLDYFRRRTKKQIVVLAPTGVAALNVSGQTIHSFFGFKPDTTIEKVRRVPKRNKARAELYRNLHTIVIDEISMVRADLLDCVDKFMRLNGPAPGLPFGGAQMIFFGDLFQLPPVVTAAEKEFFLERYRTPYFFDAEVFESGFSLDTIELDKIYRQKDRELIDILNAVRDNTVTAADLSVLNKKCDPGFEPPPDDLYIYLTTTNAMAASVNEGRLRRLPGEATVVEGVIEGDFDRKVLPTEISLRLKNRAQVMLLNNDGGGRWVNGSVGTIADIRDGGGTVDVELTDGSLVEVTPHTWKLFAFDFDERENRIVSREAGSFEQLPIKLAWAITVHKSQGKTFEKVIFDIGRGTFAHGQAYVALSRCVDLDGLVLKKPLAARHILVDREVCEFFDRPGRFNGPGH